MERPVVDWQGARVRDRLRHAVARSVVGRARERDAQLALLCRADGPAIVFVSGPGGIGKSTTVAGVTAALEHRVLTLDGRTVEPTASGFLAALARELGHGDLNSVADAGAALAAAEVGTLVVDSFERLNLLDGWLRNDFLGVLPAHLTTLVVGRRPPNLVWRTASGWRQLLAEVAVGPLDDEDARLLIDRRGLAPEAAARVLRLGGGHPLALELLAEALARHPQLDLPDGPPAEVVEELFEVLLDDLEPRERRTVEDAAVLRRVTQPLLAAVLTDAEGGVDVQLAWRFLRDLPFTRTTAIGIEFEPVARQAVAGALEIRDPARVRELRRRAAEAARAPRSPSVRSPCSPAPSTSAPAASTAGCSGGCSPRRRHRARLHPPPTRGPPAVFAQLSAREREVLTVLAEGVTNNELAERLFISERTANRHLSNIFTKLGVRTRTAAARVAIEAGLTG